MKTIVIISAICVCVGALTLEELQIGLRAVIPVCRIDSGIDEKKEDDFRNGIIDVENEKVQLFSECLIKKFNAYDDGGNFNEVVVREIAEIYLDENEVNKLITECSAISDADIHLKSSKLIKCFAKYKTLKEIMNE
ncbi:odorant binding protein 21 precursor [Apis mellifera caucasica]|uniref:OBP21 n=1 Tax=Apis mellifera TaxID=7460 RepID=A0A8U0WQH9_APIME|nr:odorant binding protein 21 precursor [Apis mellifera]ABD92653.1 OBP21 [Apis mellifera]KAG6795269.1 odorant binding protein 21 precursor [Apis mellifera caucasica]KAG9428691.1 odorant binding protein 21 precursor [Apis mellifera carnica]|eukprot:NP_001035296.1 odorant binding protein 21 precursor [Apis mellifera]